MMNRLTFPIFVISLFVVSAARAQSVVQEGTVIPMPGGAFPRLPIPAPVSPSPRLPGPHLPGLPIPALTLPVLALAAHAVPAAAGQAAASLATALPAVDGRTLQARPVAIHTARTSAEVAQRLESVRDAFGLKADAPTPEPAQLASAAFDGAAKPAQAEPVAAPAAKRTQRPIVQKPQRPQRLPEHDLERDLGIRF
ncbi:MAG: hypothetical protein NTX64_10860 [Elusimicrobia bacterium]|nr:hypothetical protein [Elusimicrobiota bacterium]